MLYTYKVSFEYRSKGIMEDWSEWKRSSIIVNRFFKLSTSRALRHIRPYLYMLSNRTVVFEIQNVEVRVDNGE